MGTNAEPITFEIENLDLVPLGIDCEAQLDPQQAAQWLASKFALYLDCAARIQQLGKASPAHGAAAEFLDAVRGAASAAGAAIGEGRPVRFAEPIEGTDPLAAAQTLLLLVGQFQAFDLSDVRLLEFFGDLIEHARKLVAHHHAGFKLDQAVRDAEARARLA